MDLDTRCASYHVGTGGTGTSDELVEFGRPGSGRVAGRYIRVARVRRAMTDTRKIAITGAAGNVGRVLRSGFDDHEVTALTHREHDDVESVVVDITDRGAFADALEGQDVLIHLAGNPSPEAEWDEVVEPNIEGTYNAYEAALANGLDRVVFASTNHVLNMYNRDDPAETEAMTTGYARTVDPDDPPRPDSYYGISKVAGEATGSYYADRHGVEVVNARIGWLLDRDELAETQDADEGSARFARAMWLSPRDCLAAMEAAATADLPENPLTVHVTSANGDRYMALTHTLRTIGYRPRDDADEALDRL